MPSEKPPAYLHPAKQFSAKDGIPAPVSIEARRSSTGLVKRLVKRTSLAAVVSFVLVSLHKSYFLRTRVEPRDDVLLPWALNAENWEFPHGPHRPPNRYHGRPLNGKPAEKLFLSVPNTESAIATSRQYAGKPHLAGSPQDFVTAVDFLQLVQKEWDIPPPRKEPIFPAGSPKSRKATLSIPELERPSAWIDIYYPVMNTPLDRSLELHSDDGELVWRAEIEEQTEGILDPDAGKYALAVPTFHGLSRGGEVQGKLVDVNYGRKEDYDALDKAGVNLTGKIVLARYGGIFRGLKVKGAEERGAVGALIYSDPRDDGSVTWDNGYAAYPFGPARNPTSVQRGSVQYISIYPGDPTTPGYPSYPNSTRTNGTNIPGIPSLPISWANAGRLLQELAEGGANRTVRLVNHVDDKVTPIWNTMAVIPGHIKDEVVLVGNHRDAWVLGATDPTSGTVSVAEVVRGLGELLKNGWKPLRTIVLASWDAEEYGLIGSTEWGEDFAEWIEKHVVAYLNLDSSVSGSRFNGRASPSLAHLLRNAAQDIPHPTIPNRTLWQARLDSGPYFGFVDKDVQAMYDEEHDFEASKFANATAPVRSDTLGISALGSGSDYTVFLQRIGIASSEGGFGSTLSDAVYHYHSVFDSEPWQERYGDPGFKRHVAVAKLLGLQLLRLADAIVLPLNTTQYAFDLDWYLNKVEDTALKLEIEGDFSVLRSSIAKLQNASLALDKEKHEAEIELKKAVWEWVRSRRSHHWKKKIRHIIHRIKRRFGWGHPRHECPHEVERLKPLPVEDNEHEDEMSLPVFKLGYSKPRIGRPVAWAKEQNERKAMDGDHSSDDDDESKRHHQHKHPKHHDHSRKQRKLWKKLVKAVRRVKAANAKLVSFERGFISEAGIKDREWYRHLGVAPGKWLGYGATTFPALTEALTIERNVTLANAEAERLQKLIESLAKKIRV